MGKLLGADTNRCELRTAGRGLGVTALVVGVGLIAACWLAVGGASGLNLWSWCIIGFGALLVVLGSYQVWHGAQVWVFDRAARQVVPPRRLGVAPFATGDVAAVVLTSPRGLGPSLLLLSLRGGRTHTLEVGGALDRSGFRVLGMLVAGFVGVPFEDQTRT